MAKIFIKIYNYLAVHKALMYVSMVLLCSLMTYFALQVRYVEDITSFFPKKAQDHDISLIFKNFKSKDRLIVMFTAKSEDDQAKSIELAKKFRKTFDTNPQFTDNATITTGVEDFSIEEMSQFVFNHLPIFLNKEDYERLDSLTQEEVVRGKVNQAYSNLMTIYGSYITDFIYTDPLSLSRDAMQKFQRLGQHYDYSINDGFLFLSNGRTLICNIDLKSDSVKVGNFIDLLEDEIATINSSQGDIKVDYFGAPAVAEYNARVIKHDSIVAINIALLIVIILIVMAFRSKRNVVLLLFPILFGTIFSLSVVFFIKGHISLIAVGSGSIIFAIALSYAIHMMAHTSHCKNIEELLSELAIPLSIGSFTTIGAFVGLMFTNSSLLQDFGLFASLLLFGTAVSSLIFLPHFLKFTKDESDRVLVLRVLNRLASMNVDKCKPFVYVVLLVTVTFAIFFNDVRFDSDMMNLNYNPPHLAVAEERLNNLANLNNNIVFVSAAKDQEESLLSYAELCNKLEGLRTEGLVESYSDISYFVAPDSIQDVRIARWNEFWSRKRKQNVMAMVNDEAKKLGFDDKAFADFEKLINRKYDNISIEKDYPKLLKDWVSVNDSLTTAMVHVKIKAENKAEVYKAFENVDNTIALDRSFFASKLAQDVRDNFMLILYISSLLIFIALLISYGRFELAVLAFLPMMVSWVVILGIMNVLGIEFNIITIILSTFIFGIGDDFSIFVMDGLLGEYKRRSSTLQHHRIAIVLSGVSLLIGMGVMIFAQHPAMYSLGVLSLIGMFVVLLVSFTVQPFLFRLLITNFTQKGGFPFTLLSLCNTIYSFVTFVLACLIVKVYMVLLFLFPISKVRRKEKVHNIVSFFLRLFLKLQPTVKSKIINERGEDFLQPSVIVSNHKSFIDILVLLALSPKFLMMTKAWVWNSPIFGSVVRYLDFFCTDEGYENSLPMLKEKVAEGYSIVVFPEGTRSEDHSIKRFHKGAFYLAEKLQLDILPIVLYGNGLVSSKRQPLYIKKGDLVMKVLERIPYGDMLYGANYVEQTKSVSKLFRIEYNIVYEQFNRVSNKYYSDTLLKNYVYKGPVLEWYMRVKLAMENYYEEYDYLLPREGRIVDLGCGYGALSYMMMLLSNKRKVLGVDYDKSKIEVANNCFSRNENIHFECGDIRNYDIPSADAYVISDVLHYVDKEMQMQVIQKCIDGLSDGGLLIIRDGDADLKERHRNTEQTEFWSTKIIKFNITDGELHFLSRTEIEEVANKNGMSVVVKECDKKTSNTLFILRRL